MRKSKYPGSQVVALLQELEAGVPRSCLVVICDAADTLERRREPPRHMVGIFDHTTSGSP
jgi:hypothetical protein